MKKKLLAIFVGLISFLPISRVVWANISFSEIELWKYYWPITLLINTHLEIWNGIDDNANLTFEYYTTLLSAMKQMTDFDVVAYLWKSIDIESSLMYVLDNYSKLLSKSQAVQNTLALQLERLVQTKEECNSSKDLSDKSFSLALKDYNPKEMERYLNLSLNYDRCSSESRIYYNVYKKILSQIEYFHGILEVRNTYFNENKYEILENYPNVLYKISR